MTVFICFSLWMRVFWVCSDWVRCCGLGGGQPIMKIRRHRRVYYTSHFVSSCKLLQRKNTSHKLDLLMRIDEKHQMINIQISH